MAQLYFYYSAMNAGKSTALLQAHHNYQERGMKTLLYTAKIDTRYGQNVITSRIGIHAKAKTFDSETNMYEEVYLSQKKQSIQCLLIDEAHFLTKEQVFSLSNIVDSLDIPVLAYGIRSDFQAEPFEGSIYLLALAESLVELKTICHCGKKATMNLRIDEDGQAVRHGQQIEIAGNERYIATCRKHFFEGDSGKTLNTPLNLDIINS